MATTETHSAINIGVWHKDLRATFELAPVGPGSVALLELLNLQQAQALTYVAGLSQDIFIERGLGSWTEDMAGAQERLAWMVAKLASIVGSSDNYEVKLVAIYNFIARPVLDGLYPQAMLDALSPVGRRGIIRKPDGGGKGFGDAFVSATLWNQAVVAGDIDRKLGNDWATNAVREVLTKAAIQLEKSAPGEDATLVDVVGDKLRALADVPGDVLRAITGGWLPVVVGGVVVGGVLYLLLRR